MFSDLSNLGYFWVLSCKSLLQNSLKLFQCLIIPRNFRWRMNRKQLPPLNTFGRLKINHIGSLMLRLEKTGRGCTRIIRRSIGMWCEGLRCPFCTRLILAKRPVSSGKCSWPPLMCRCLKKLFKKISAFAVTPHPRSFHKISIILKIDQGLENKEDFQLVFLSRK